MARQARCKAKNKTHAQHIRQKHCYAFKHMLYLKYASDLLYIRQYMGKKVVLCGHLKKLCKNSCYFRQLNFKSYG
jgi:hypothetical protein